MKLDLTQSEIQQITEGSLGKVIKSGLGLKSLAGIAKGYGNIIGANAAGYRAVQDDAAAGKPVSYDRAYEMGKEEYYSGKRSSNAWRQAFKKSHCEGDVVQLIYDEYTRVFYQQRNRGVIPLGNGMIECTMHGQTVQRRMNGAQKDLHDAMYELLEIAKTI